MHTGSVFTRVLAFALFAGLSLHPPWSHASPPGDKTAGAQKAAVCFGCHGRDGNSTSPDYPKLAGQLYGYILKETLDFKSGARKDAIMSGVIQIIPEVHDLQDIAAYFSSLPVMRGKIENEELAARGKQLFSSERCFFCHEEGGKPDGEFTPKAPVIGGQNKGYLFKTMRDIRDGKRRADVYNLMPQLLTRLTDDDLKAIAEFLGGL